jgi:D-lyxose ketol-isomerase
MSASIWRDNMGAVVSPNINARVSWFRKRFRYQASTGRWFNRKETMKRSEINTLIRDAETFFCAHQFALPPFASWTPDHWDHIGREADEIRKRALGWDITDFGSGDFQRIGLLLCTIRNGDVNDQRNSKCYAEKIMIVRERQLTPWHFHWNKIEDIINRGGGNLVMELAWSAADESGLDDPDVEVCCDGVVRTVHARGHVLLTPGESITLPPKLAHQFYGEPGHGMVLVGEVSKTNDDSNDNCFLNAGGRFPAIEEDEPPYRLLCHEYPSAARGGPNTQST